MSAGVRELSDKSIGRGADTSTEKKVSFDEAVLAVLGDLKALDPKKLRVIPEGDGCLKTLQEVIGEMLLRSTFFKETLAEVAERIYQVIPESYDAKMRSQIVILLLEKTCQFPAEFGRKQPRFSQEIINEWLEKLKPGISELKEIVAALGEVQIKAASPPVSPVPVPPPASPTLVRSSPPERRGWGAFLLRALCCCFIKPRAGVEMQEAMIVGNPMLSGRYSHPPRLRADGTARPQGVFGPHGSGGRQPVRRAGDYKMRAP